MCAYISSLELRAFLVFPIRNSRQTLTVHLTERILWLRIIVHLRAKFFAVYCERSLSLSSQPSLDRPGRKHQVYFGKFEEKLSRASRLIFELGWLESHKPFGWTYKSRSGSIYSTQTTFRRSWDMPWGTQSRAPACLAFAILTLVCLGISLATVVVLQRRKLKGQ